MKTEAGLEAGELQRRIGPLSDQFPEPFETHAQMAMIAQGVLQTLAILYPKVVWQNFGSWLRTVRPGVAPSEWVVSMT